MPVLDLPLDKLKSYRGINPRPDDFTEYWDKALEEMRAVDPEVEMIPSGFTAPGVRCSDYFYTGVGGPGFMQNTCGLRNLLSGTEPRRLFFFTVTQ
jgi:cephalosporin-C deacetylase-like acetyl esterase